MKQEYNDNNITNIISSEQLKSIGEAITDILNNTPDNNDDDFDNIELEHDPYQSYLNQENDSELEL